MNIQKVLNFHFLKPYQLSKKVYQDNLDLYYFGNWFHKRSQRLLKCWLAVAKLKNNETQQPSLRWSTELLILQVWHIHHLLTIQQCFDFSDPVKDIFIIFGRESTGIPHDILREHEDKLMRIPMVPEARSLNLSNCVALVAYEVLRQQKFPDLATEEAIKGPDFLFKD